MESQENIVEEDPREVVFERLDNIKHTDEKGRTTWSGRKLFKALDISRWSDFKLLVNECKKTIRENHTPAESKKIINEYFEEASIIINTNTYGIRKLKEVDDFKITAYGAHLICCANVVIETTNKNYQVNQYALEYFNNLTKEKSA